MPSTATRMMYNMSFFPLRGAALRQLFAFTNCRRPFHPCFSPGGAICGATISPRGSFVNATRTISRIAPNPLENRYHIVVPKPFDVAPERHLPSNLTNAPALKAALIDAWPRSVADKIASAQTVKLEGKLAEYVDAFDYSIFQPMSPREVIEQHRATPTSSRDSAAACRRAPSLPRRLPDWRTMRASTSRVCSRPMPITPRQAFLTYPP